MTHPLSVVSRCVLSCFAAQLLKRSSKRMEAEEELKEAKETGDQEDINRYTKRLVRVTPEHNADVKRLLTLMGVPIVDSPSEAEAQCAELVKKGVVWATATEDMDALTFGTPRLLRHMSAAEGRKQPIVEIELDAVLSGLGLTMAEFIDVCILVSTLARCTASLLDPSLQLLCCNLSHLLLAVWCVW